MLNTQEFGSSLKKFGFNFYSGIPCSFLKNLINYAINDCQYINAANEGDALAAAAGAQLGGQKSVVLLQNSGLGNAVSPLTSLIYTFKLPVLGFISLRGEPGLKDEPQHELMGEITTSLLDTMKVKWAYLSDDQKKASKQLELANKSIENNEAFFFVVKKGTFDTVTLVKKESNDKTKNYPSRLDVLKTLYENKKENTALLATTGVTGRELYEIKNDPNHFYQVGSMGCITSLGLGLALAQPKKEVLVIDGDGATLMRLGNFAALGHEKPKNLLHILLDNELHESTGGQDTLSGTVNFSQIAKATGYERVIICKSDKGLISEIDRWRKTQKLTFIIIKTKAGIKDNLGRPTNTPQNQKERFQDWIND
jgi:phosphonopyruvate decarboxylase